MVKVFLICGSFIKVFSLFSCEKCSKSLNDLKVSMYHSCVCNWIVKCCKTNQTYRFRLLVGHLRVPDTALLFLIIIILYFVNARLLELRKACKRRLNYCTKCARIILCEHSVIYSKILLYLCACFVSINNGPFFF